MGHTATIIAVAYAVVVVLCAAFFVYIGLSTRRGPDEPEPDAHRLGERERIWFVVVIVLLAVLLFATIFFTPYGRSAGSGAQVVKVKAVQFAWLVPGKPIRAGTPVEFQLNSEDVNHAFAVYNSAGTLLFEVQVMPKKTQKYVYTFEKPGTYQILCLEFCGVGHARMQGQLTVSR